MYIDEANSMTSFSQLVSQDSVKADLVPCINSTNGGAHPPLETVIKNAYKVQGVHNTHMYISYTSEFNQQEWNPELLPLLSNKFTMMEDEEQKGYKI